MAAAQGDSERVSAASQADGAASQPTDLSQTATTTTTSSEPADEQTSSIAVVIKHGSSEYRIENLMLDHTIQYLKEQIEELTNVRSVRQKLFGIKAKKAGQQLTDELTLEDTSCSDGMKIMMMGSQEKEILGVKQASRGCLSQVEDDFEIYDNIEDFDLDSRIPKAPEYRAKIARRVQHYKIKMLNEPRPNKKLLVLDIDYTLFDHRSVAQSADELARPYLHEFLELAYKDYDIVIWSATSMRYIEAKMRELRVETNPNYKIVFYLDSAAMISVHSQKYGLLNVKPLAVIWGKFAGQYSQKNTIMFDDTRRNFLMNPQNGLKIKAFRDAHTNRATDEELLHLSKYLARIADMDDFGALDHKHWQRLVDAPKRHKGSRGQHD